MVTTIIENGDLLIGKIALRDGLITRKQLYDCLLAQERNPSKPLGQIFILRGYATNEDIQRLLEIQKKLFETPPEDALPARGKYLLGKVLIDRGWATEYQVNECLRLQARLLEVGIQPTPPLGQILMNRGYLTRETLDAALHLQNLHLYSCPNCGTAIHLDEDHHEKNRYTCPSCAAEVPILFAKLAATVHEALEDPKNTTEVELPEEVTFAEQDLSNHFGKYILVKEIGRGGAGVVFRAWQKDLNRYVALKMLLHDSDTAAGIRTPFGDAEDVKRFYAEIRAAADLDHPNIVKILDFAQMDNHYYYTMSLVEGVTIDRLVREGINVFQTLPPSLLEENSGALFTSTHVPFKWSAELMRDAAWAVDYAHSRGIYHRDLKPSNILIDLEGRPWITDFGLAKVVHIGDPAYVKGVIIGTPYYMPPEQAEGDMDKVDYLSDIYSLGAILYELVTGYSPFAGKSSDDVLDLLLKKSPESPRTLNPQIPPPLESIILKAMHRNRRRRYATAKALADDLDRFIREDKLAEEPMGAENPPFWRRLFRRLFQVR